MSSKKYKPNHSDMPVFTDRIAGEIYTYFINKNVCVLEKDTEKLPNSSMLLYKLLQLFQKPMRKYLPRAFAMFITSDMTGAFLTFILKKLIITAMKNSLLPLWLINNAETLKPSEKYRQ